MAMLSRWSGRGSTNGRGNSPSRQQRNERGEHGDMMPVSRPLMNLQQQVNRVFEEFFGESPMSRFESSMGMMGPRRFHPRMDLSETAEEFRLTADVPGMDENDIEITVSDDALSISGERSEMEESEDVDYFRQERSYGMFHRRMPLPNNIDRDNINARFKNGVLTVHMPKTEEARSQWRKVEVQSEN